jgi:hypothetical protein
MLLEKPMKEYIKPDLEMIALHTDIICQSGGHDGSDTGNLPVGGQSSVQDPWENIG